MDAVEKVARGVFDAEWSITPWRTKPDWSDVVEDDRRDYMDMATHLLAAFPQLALEGREKWAQQPDNDLPYSLHGYVRTVWESQWSEVHP